MLLWTLQMTIVSIILIFLLHSLFGFFKSTLTVPKIKDLVHAPAQKYETMFHIMSNAKDIKQPSKSSTEPEPPPRASMKNELKNFLKSRLQGEDTTDISTLTFGERTSTLNFASAY
jgi:ABC-type bacteriocin/lantibiotic exporter with double-glycine peptidase domain